MTTVLHMDYETFSEEELRSAGVFRYAEHPSTEIIACTYHFVVDGVDQVPVLWIPYDPNSVPRAIIEEVKKLRPGVSVLAKATCPLPLSGHIVAGGEVRAHNAQFERVITNGVAGKKLGIPAMRIEQMVCTAAKMAASGIPRSLDDAAKALGVPGKSAGGRIEMLQLCKPRRPTKDNPDTRFTMEKFPEKWVAMLVYNIDDVPAERGIDDAVPDLIASEQEIYRLDQRINERGIAVNLSGVRDILFVVERYKEFLAKECQSLTEDWMGIGLQPTQREKIAEWVRTNGYPNLVDMQADTVKALVKQEGVPECVKRLLVIYSTYNAKSVSKLQAMLDAVCSDGRLRGMFLYHGAGPGRWSSLIVQLQNLMRPVIDDPVAALEAFATRDLDWVRMMYPDVDVMKVAGSLTRACLVASPDHDLIFVDFSGIESRVNPWFFGEEWCLEAFRKQDADESAPDNYELAYCTAFNLPPQKLPKKLRQIGKCMELFFNYEGGVSAFLTAVDTYGINLQEMTDAVLPLLSAEARDHGEWMWAHHRKSGVTHDQSVACDGLKFLWRQNHPSIKQGWKDLKRAAEQAAEFQGQAFGIPSGKIWFKVVAYKNRNWLHMRLPSGRDIKYYAPSWVEPKTVHHPDGKEVNLPGEMRYMGIDKDTMQWQEMSTYGGKLDENADQGYASCLLRHGIRSLEAAGYSVVGTVHDEAVVEVPKDFGSLEEACRLMCAQPKHADGLPLAAEGKRQEFYWK